MPRYAFEHLHHETADVAKVVEFYCRLFGATAEPPFERGGATWAFVHVGEVKITVSDRPCEPRSLGRYQGYDHLALTTDDFDATLEQIRKEQVAIWTGPLTLDTGKRLVFVNGPDNVKIELLEKG